MSQKKPIMPFSTLLNSPDIPSDQLLGNFTHIKHGKTAMKYSLWLFIFICSLFFNSVYAMPEYNKYLDELDETNLQVLNELIASGVGLVGNGNISQLSQLQYVDLHKNQFTDETINDGCTS